jgi:nucleolar pre-ribosomal-associated protein 2
LSTVLSLHRHRVRGRYHLATELLQSLLCCLFTSPTVRRKTLHVASSSRPPWLQGSVLSVISARAFSRVLHAFCEPPASTVRAHGTELIDSQRVKEKRCVSKVLGPILDTYARQLLEARIAADVRKEVGIGMESVIGVLGREGLQKIVAGMSAEGRVVVRGLWAAYSRGARERV